MRSTEHALGPSLTIGRMSSLIRRSRGWGGSGVEFSMMAALMVAIPGCGDASLWRERTWTSTHFHYVARADDSGACEGVMENAEAHYGLLHGYFARDVPLVHRIEYTKYLDVADLAVRSGCPPAAAACTGDTGLASVRALDEHELVHAYLRSLGRPPAMFEEGVAEALSPQGRTFVAPTFDWREVLAAPPVQPGVAASVAYWAGGWFVSSLLHDEGPVRFLSLYERLSPDSSADEVATAFAEIYGTSLDMRWQAARDDHAEMAGIPLWECAGAPIPLDGQSHLMVDHCDGGGPFITFDGTPIDAMSSPTWSDARLSAGFDLAGCSARETFHLSQLAWTGPGEIGALDLPPGRYYLSPSVGQGSVRLASQVGLLSAGCAEVTAMVLPAPADHFTVGLGNGSVPRFVKLATPGNRAIGLTRLWDNPLVPDEVSAGVQMCLDCTRPCQALQGTTFSAIPDGQILRFTGDPVGAAALVRFAFH
jgi:hypothetical protein